METNYNALRMPDLSALVREHEVRGYYRLRKAELIAFLSFDPCLFQDPLRNQYLFQDLLRNLYLLQNLLLHNLLSVNQNAPDLRNLQDLLPHLMKKILASFREGSLEFLNQWKEWDGCANLP